MTDNINNSPDKENGSKTRYATIKEIPHTCDTCNNYLKKKGDCLRYDTCMCQDWSRCELANYSRNRNGRLLSKETDGIKIHQTVTDCPHWQTKEICADCKYAINPRYHNEAVGFATFTCKCYGRTVIDIEVACKRYRLRGGDTI